MTKEEIEDATPDQLVEEGIGLIARGMYRMYHQQGREAASNLGQAATSAVRGTWLDFAREQKPREKV